MILDEIVSKNKQETDERKRRLPFAEIERMAGAVPPPLDFKAAISRKGINLIAEVKKASPSRGTLLSDFDPVQIATTYASSGAAAISVLTESRYFLGSLNSLSRIRNSLVNKGIPLLRKDFLSDPYQIYESRVYGADALLLIAAILTKTKLKGLLELSHDLGMDCLVEVHSEKEVETAIESGARIIGINNRDLSTFEVNINTTERLRRLIPSDRIVVSESGLKTREDIEKLKELGVNAVLIGEALVSAPDIRNKIKELMKIV
jgi:indole-3-glycerol phosphate synthase